MRPENSQGGQESGAGKKKRSFIEEARRAQIIQAAIETIAEEGYANASLARIAKHAGISKGVISYHFAGKDELLHEVVVQVYTKVAEAVAPAIGAQSDAVGALRTHITAVAGYMREHRTELLALSSIFLGARGSEGEPRYGITGNEELYQGLEYIFRWGQEEGVFRDFDRRVMAVTFQAAVDAMFGYWVAYPEHDLEGHARELADLFENAARAGR
ncbi:TetR/AcrR family transcriptional regulator [Nocardiopsis composta]|uniref:AcrR family transcriptional regulator n=1 Tax=Nocardiopsis composta TaxID=157465 RepID=A0A7W8QHG7_9ACTN|nr:TetR/AcrR family transcriptional regulator [Nocardiopsis composta]MBB5430537.1 AcrR family transcriptional regulator [Nocardiopsis composta]